MNISALSSLAIIGVAVSILVQYLKQHFDNTKAQVIVVALAILTGTGYYLLQTHTNLLANIIAILAMADTIYSYILQYFENKPTAPAIPTPPAPPAI